MINKVKLFQQVKKHNYLFIPPASFILAISAFGLMAYINSITFWVSAWIQLFLIIPLIPLFLLSFITRSIPKWVLVNALASLSFCLIFAFITSSRGSGFEGEVKSEFDIIFFTITNLIFFIPIFIIGATTIVLGLITRYLLIKKGFLLKGRQT